METNPGEVTQVLKAMSGGNGKAAGTSSPNPFLETGISKGAGTRRF